MSEDNQIYRPISVESLEALKAISVPVFLKTPQGFVLYKSADHPINDNDIARLHRNGTESVFLRAGDAEQVNTIIEAELSSLISDPDVALNKKATVLTQASSNYLAEVFEQPSKAADRERCALIVDNIIRYITVSPTALQELTRIASHDFYVYVHSVQVAALVVAMHSRVFKVDRDELIDVGTGSLLHDLGLLYVPKQILAKNGHLSKDDRMIYRRHPEDGYLYLKTQGVYPESTLNIVRLHHERLDGKGYPVGLAGTSIMRSVLIASLCDAYVHRTGRTIFGPPMAPAAAIADLATMPESPYRHDLICHLASLLGLQPPEAAVNNERSS